MTFLLKFHEHFVFFLILVSNQLRWAITRFTRKNKNTFKCLVGKTAIVTGGSTGHGYEVCKNLASRGCKVIIASNADCESEKQKLIELTGNPNITTKYLNLSSFNSVRKFAEDIKKTESKIDFLVNNAGVGLLKEVLSEDGFNNMMQISYLGHFLLVHLLVDLLKASGSARVVFVATSGSYCHRMEPNDIYAIPEKGEEIRWDHYFSYYINAKLCGIVAAAELAERLEKYGIKVNSMDPGVFRSQITRDAMSVDSTNAWMFKAFFGFALNFYSHDVSEAAQNTMYVLTADDVKNGELYFRCSPHFKPHKVNNREFSKKIWDISVKCIGLKDNEKLL